MSLNATLPAAPAMAGRRLAHVLSVGGVIDVPPAEREFRRGRVEVNGSLAGPDAVVEEGDEVSLQGARYAVVRGGAGRLHLSGLVASDAYVDGPVRVHCGLHKCLTMFTRRIYRHVARYRGVTQPWSVGGFRHFYHRADAFRAHADQYALTSISGHAFDLDRFRDIRVVRFVRDPRDLVVSGYHYHRRAAEHWCEFVEPEAIDYAMVNGCVPSDLGSRSLAAYLNEVPLADGLRAEVEFRQNHFASMLAWPQDDPRVLTVRYEDLLGREAEVFGAIGRHFGWSSIERVLGRRLAARYRAGRKEASKGHIRNPATGQWRTHFSAELAEWFHERHGELLNRLGYPVDVATSADGEAR